MSPLNLSAPLAAPLIPSSLSDLEERELFEIFSSPWRWAEAIGLLNRDGTPRKYWDHQKVDLDDTAPLIVHQDGTEVGKSVDIATLVLHFIFSSEGQECLVVAPLSGHLDPLIAEVEFQFDHSEILRSCLRPYQPVIKQPYYKIMSATGSTVHFRPTSGDGESYKSLHVHKILLDEAAGISNKAWSILFQRLLPGGQMRAYSYPDGRRTTPYFRATKSKRWKRYHWPMRFRPDWSQARDDEKADEFGGRDSPEYQHFVLGEHGSARTPAFDLESFFACLKEIPEYRTLSLSGADFRFELQDGAAQEFKEAEIDAKIAQIFSAFGGVSQKDQKGLYWLGCDTGYTSDPAELRVWREEARHMKCVLRVNLVRVHYLVQAKIIAALDRRLHFRAIGIDAGGNGTSVIQDLHGRKEFQDLRELEDRLVSIDFGGTSVIEVESDGKEHKQYNKELMTKLLNEAMRRRQATWPKQCRDTEEEYTNHSYTRTDRHIVYSKGKDHIIDADRCAYMAREFVLRLREFAGGFIEVRAVSAVSIGGVL